MRIPRTKGGLAVINITSYCNSNCIFCKEGKHDHPFNVPLETIKKTLLKLKTLGVNEVNFMGGETALRSDLEEIFQYTKKQGMTIGLVTNGLRFSDPVFAKRILKFVTFMEISIHAADKKMYHAISGRDCFEKLLRGIENINAYNQCSAVFFNFVPNSINASKMTDVFRLVKKIWPKNNAFFHIKKLAIKGKVKTAPQLLPNDAELRKLLRTALRYAAENKIGVCVSGFPLCAYDGFEHLSLELLHELKKNKNFFTNSYLLTENTDFSCPKTSIRKDTHFPARCHPCGLKRICPGLDQQYFEIKNSINYLTPQKKNIRSVVKEFLLKNTLFQGDYFYHYYPFKGLFKKHVIDMKRAEKISRHMEKLLLT
ncbi:MAG: radical SAM protein [Candidatus Omnitrophota bacterium]|nr:radical SAM protein [Candidatus Omnitrophota bacterium]